MADLTEEFLKALKALDESTQFCVIGNLPPVLPGLEVEGIGPVGVPVSPSIAKQLILHASQAPYGRGEETIIDPNVRRVWQLEPRQFSLDNPDWEPFLDGIVATVKTEFGITGEVKHNLYKLLVYEKGSFFAPHRDSEKQDGMFATLIVCLPSLHQGGTLIVEHDREKKEIDFGGPQGEYRIQYVAFYTDCRHEIKPVTEGHRVCLVYNLSLAKVKHQPSAPQNLSKIECVAALLPRLFNEAPTSDEEEKEDEEEDQDEEDLEEDAHEGAGRREKIAIPLKHEYTAAGLSRDLLKGEDRWTVDLLLQATSRLGYRLFLALMTYSQTGEPDYDSDYYSSRRYSRWGSDEEDASSHEMGEVYEEDLTLDHWIDPEGQKQPLGKMELDENEIISDVDFEDFPFEQSYHEATGNEGATLERWYHQAVVVIWPPEHHFGIVAGQGQGSAIPALEALIARTRNASSSEECRAFAGAIINNWRSSAYAPTDDAQSTALAQQLERLGDPALVVRFVTEVLPKECSGDEGKILSSIAGKLGWDTLAEPLTRFVAGQLPTSHTARLAATARLVAGLCGTREMTAEQKKVCQAVLAELDRTVAAWDKSKDTISWSRGAESREAVVEGLVRSADAIEAADVLERFLTAALANRTHYGLHAVLIPVAKKLHAWKSKGEIAAAAEQRIVAHCIGELESLTARPVVVPSGWAQDFTINCTCADCRELQRFIRDPNEQVHRFRVAKARRQHLHQIIDSHGCDMTHLTTRQGSPYTLVCTKNRASYDRKKVQFGIDVQLLAELREMVKAEPKPKAKKKKK